MKISDNKKMLMVLVVFVFAGSVESILMGFGL